MNAQLHSLITHQHERMRELRDDARDIADTVADEVWDKFEVEIEKATEDGYMFDMAPGTQMALSFALNESYDNAFDRHVLGLFERLVKQLHEAGAHQAVFDDTRLNLTGMRKGLKLNRHAREWIEQAIENAKPGLIGMLFASRDPCSDDWDREEQENARRLRKQLHGLRGNISEAIREETATVIQTARLAYIDMLGTVLGKLAAAQADKEAA